MARDHKGKVKIVKVEYDDCPDLLEKYKVQGVPAIVLIKDGEEVSRLTGADSPNDAKIRTLVESVL